MKRTPFKRKLKPLVKPFALASKRPKKASRTKKPSIASLRTKADSLCTPVALKLNPRCLLCNEVATVGHHAVKKSESSNLRYYLPNIISLCGRCHCKLHARETIWCVKVREIMGDAWWKDIESKIWVLVKTDRFFYMEAIERLSGYIQ